MAGYARRFGLDQFRLLARHLGDVLDPDGVLRDAKYRDRQRGLNIRQRPDGSVTGSFEGTAEFGEALLSLLDKTAAPKPEADGTKDPRTPAQRRHDGLLDAMSMLLRSGQLGDCNGVSTTILVMMSEEQARTGDGMARTGHGALIPVPHVLANIGDARIFPVILDNPPPTTGPAARAARCPAVRHRETGRRLRQHPTHLHRRPTASHDRPGQGMFIPRLHHRPGMVSGPPHHPMAIRPAHLHRQRGTTLRLPPPRIREFGVGLRHGQRNTPLPATPLARRPTHPTTQHRPRHPRCLKRRRCAAGCVSLSSGRAHSPRSCWPVRM